MSYELTGKILEIFPEQQVTEKFKKREFVIETENNGFTDQVKMQLIQDKTPIIEAFATSDEVKVSFNIRGNKWKDNYFVNLQAWRIEKLSESTGNTPADMPPAPGIDDLPPLPDEGDDLPF